MEKEVSFPKTTRYEVLLEFLENNHVVIRRKKKPCEVKCVNNLWEQFVNKMNTKKTGTFKSSLQSSPFDPQMVLKYLNNLKTVNLT